MLLEVVFEDDFVIVIWCLLIVLVNMFVIKFVVEFFGIIFDCGCFWVGFNLIVFDFNLDNMLESDGVGGGNILDGKFINGGGGGVDDKFIIGGGVGGVGGGGGGGGGGGDVDGGLGLNVFLGNIVGILIIVLVLGVVFGLIGLRWVWFFLFLIVFNNCCLLFKGVVGWGFVGIGGVGGNLDIDGGGGGGGVGMLGMGEGGGGGVVGIICFGLVCLCMIVGIGVGVVGCIMEGCLFWGSVWGGGNLIL